MDYITSHAFYLAFLCLYAVALAALAWRNPRLSGARWFAASVTVELGKVLLQSMSGNAPRVLTTMLANELNIADFFLMYAGFCWFVERRPTRQLLMASVTAGWMSAYASLFLLRNPFSFFIMGLAVVMLCAATVVRLARQTTRRFQAVARVTVGLLAVHLVLLIYHMGLSVQAYSRHLPGHAAWNDARWRYSMLGIMLIGGCLLGTYLWFTLAEIMGRVADTASLDALTGMLNRRALAARAEAEVASCAVNGRQLSVVAIDLDHFKTVNDTYGHGGGDAALCAVAAELLRLVRPEDVLARMGGEEFLLVLPGVDAAGAMATAEQMRAAIEGMRIAYDGIEMEVTASAGVTEMLGGSDSWDAAVKRADLALYQAKATGRNRVVQDERTLSAAPDEPWLATAGD